MIGFCMWIPGDWLLYVDGCEHALVSSFLSGWWLVMVNDSQV